MDHQATAGHSSIRAVSPVLVLLHWSLHNFGLYIIGKHRTTADLPHTLLNVFVLPHLRGKATFCCTTTTADNCRANPYILVNIILCPKLTRSYASPNANASKFIGSARMKYVQKQMHHQKQKRCLRIPPYTSVSLYYTKEKSAQNPEQSSSVVCNTPGSTDDQRSEKPKRMCQPR